MKIVLNSTLEGGGAYACNFCDKFSNITYCYEDIDYDARVGHFHKDVCSEECLNLAILQFMGTNETKKTK